MSEITQFIRTKIDEWLSVIHIYGLRWYARIIVNYAFSVIYFRSTWKISNGRGVDAEHPQLFFHGGQDERYHRHWTQYEIPCVFINKTPETWLTYYHILVRNTSSCICICTNHWTIVCIHRFRCSCRSSAPAHHSLQMPSGHVRMCPRLV